MYLNRCILHLLILSFAHGTLHAAETTLNNRQLLGPEGIATRKQKTPVTLTWRDVPLREAVVRLGGSQGFSVWFDRRVDSGQLISLSAEQKPLGEVFGKVASLGEATAVPIGDLYYVGPPESAQEIRTLLALGRQQTVELPAEQRAAMTASGGLSIPRLTDPRELIDYLARRGKMRIEGLGQVPHDLWPATQYPSVATCDLLTLALVGFDLTWQVESSGKLVRIKPIERPVTIRHLHNRTQVDKVDNSLKAAIKTSLAQQAGKTWVIATVEQHEQIIFGESGRPVSRPATRPARNEKQVFTLRVAEQPVGAIVKQLARQLGKQLEIDPTVTQTMLETRVTFEVKEADLVELFTAACKPAGIAVQVAGDKISLQPSGD